jgi:hypothetical protein
MRYFRCGNNPSIVDSLIYFSFMTLTSVAYGDISPHPLARSLADVEAIIGQTRLVTLGHESRRAS